ncbi:MAG: enoyl-[acyl-carrier protein] reductase/trans-2-enoyl-CoA reductase (NAD+), partial [Candidatus Azotimanducaceae bacterium]
PDVQQAVADIWPGISSETLYAESDYAGYQENFLSLFGFGLPGVDYEEDVDVEIDLPSNGQKVC